MDSSAAAPPSQNGSNEVKDAVKERIITSSQSNAPSSTVHRTNSQMGGDTISSSDVVRTNLSRHNTANSIQSLNYYGKATVSTVQGNFPSVGSSLGPWFCLGQLGAGTFACVYQCIDLQEGRLAASKVEGGEQGVTGVLESESVVLDFLSRSMPKGTVPEYYGHYRTKNKATSALLMQYISGQDMHQLREQVMGNVNNSSRSRRIHLEDAVFLTADVLLPLLQELHKVGMVHRDVKPSNCMFQARRDGGNHPSKDDFVLVDFGLSKSVIIPESNSEASDKIWTGEHWMRPFDHFSSTSTKAVYRKERPKADFRGTSMYASLQIHRGRDYAARDDVWSLLYVFCDLVSGGLPWMSHAANKDRASCQSYKERVHRGHVASRNALEEDCDTKLLLMGDHYHTALFRKEKHINAGGDPDKVPPLPEPLQMSKDERKIQLLRDAFTHVASLGFSDEPDYSLIQTCIKGFLQPTNFEDIPIPRIDYSAATQKYSPGSPDLNHRRLGYPEWQIEEGSIMKSCGVDFESIQEQLNSERAENGKNLATVDRSERLPIQFQFQVAQLKYHHQHGMHGGVSLDFVLKDWMQVASPLLHKEWDSRKYEDGGHRTSTDGFRREHYLSLLQLCWDCAKAFDFFRSLECHFQLPAKKRRKVTIHSVSDEHRAKSFVFLSRTLMSLQHALAAEVAKKPPPPVRISFS